MELTSLFILLLLSYILVLVAIGWHFARQQRNMTDFWLAGREIGAVAIGFSAAASWLTAGAILAVIGFFMLLGMGSIWGFVFPNIAALIVIALLVKKIRRYPAITQPELLEHRYSHHIRAPIAIIITIVMVLFSVADIRGFAMVLEIVYGLNPIYAALIVAVAVSLYVGLGGLSAVVWTDTVQFLLLAGLVISMAFVTMNTAIITDASLQSASDIMGAVDTTWWNPLTVGIPMILIFIFAIIPGWVSEQDPWQKVWGAKSDKAATFGMLLGAGLVALVFAGTAIIAIALNALYPEIAAMGFPAGIELAEPALLTFMAEYLTPLGIALATIGFAAAAMSCTDTFVTSGASCVSRDIYQRYIKPEATMKEMVRMNRILLVLLVFAATVLSFFIVSIIDIIHIATYIASAAYFFPLMGGLFWKRATKEGAIAGLVIGGGSQISLILYEALFMSGNLGDISIILSEHGVIIGLLLGGISFIGVSLATPRTEDIRLAAFFDGIPAHEDEQKHIDERSHEFKEFTLSVNEQKIGDRGRMELTIYTENEFDWDYLINNLKSRYGIWMTPVGKELVYRFTDPDLLGCVKAVKNDTKQIQLSAEPRVEKMDEKMQTLYHAKREVEEILRYMLVDIRKE